MRHRPEGGFTIIELMVTVAVFAVLVALATPSFRAMMVKSQLRGATDDVVNLLNQARNSAIKLQRDVNVSVNAAKWCAGAISAGAPTNVGDPIPATAACSCGSSTVDCKISSDTAIVDTSAYSGVTMTTTTDNLINASKGGITFNSKFGALGLGSVPVNPAITLSAENNKYSTQISISQLGQAYVCRPANSFISGYPSC